MPKVPTIQDEQLKLQAAGALTASGNGTAVDLGSGFAPDGGGQPMQAVIPVAAIDRADSDETYAFKLQDSADNVTFADRGESVSVTAVGLVQVKAFITARYVRLVRTIGGTTPSITVGNCYLNPITVR